MNKKLVLIIAVFVWCSAAVAQGVEFKNIPFEKAIEQSAVEQKMVFIDFYATWCAPCKHMTDSVFTREEAGDYFNPKFVNIKIDVEEGNGPALAKRYEVSALPTFVVLDQDGNMLLRLVGGGALENFIKRMEAGLDEETRKTRFSLEEKYKSAEISIEDLQVYWTLVNKDGSLTAQKVKEIANRIFSQLSDSDKRKKENVQILLSLASNLEEDGMKFILKNRKIVGENASVAQVDKLIHGAFSRALEAYCIGAINEDMAKKLPAILSQLDAIDFAGKAAFTDMAEVANVRVKNDVDLFLDYIETHYMRMDDYRKQNLVGGIERTGSEKTKAQYFRMAQVVEKVGSSIQSPIAKEFVMIFGSRFGRLGATGVYWQPFQTFESALIQARLSRKPIFLDAYTEWCAPCKLMEKDVFPQKEIGDFMNEHFICIKMDMEKGEGLEIAKKYGIAAYPTYIIINPDGSMKHRFVGYYPAGKFIETTREAFDSSTALGTMQKQFEAGNRNTQFLWQYMNALRKISDSHSAEVAELIFSSVVEDRQNVSSEMWIILGDPMLSPAGSKAEKYLLANLSCFRAAIGRTKVDRRIGDPYFNKLTAIVSGADLTTSENDIDKMLHAIKKNGLEQEATLIARGSLAKLIRQEVLDVKRFKKALIKIPAEDVPYSFLYSRLKTKFNTQQEIEWKKWGLEIKAETANK